ncbi:hypothetical protein DB44_FF00220 [Candidatus Protochlamydia amoebophila]|uniref:Uncharacterized protein n=2 Tax=Candidatus Protochlamydia amoebophila TaxID=362787 RepID=A0A0C1JJZ6_9BACT|nr:hypothetical protein DB44_FF00220 [Candidatus Protochlamydia amoebophila]
MRIFMEYYYKSMPENLTWTQKIEYTADVIVRDIGYVPILGLAVVILRIITGVAQKAI